MGKQKHSYPWDIWKKNIQAEIARGDYKGPRYIPPLEIIVSEPTPEPPKQDRNASGRPRKYNIRHWEGKPPHGNTKDLSSRFVVKGEICEIHTPSGQIAIVDAADLDMVKDYPWCHSGGYLHAYKRGTSGTGKVMVRLHRMLIDAPKGMYVDHIDGNPLNNRRSNLRLATPSQNTYNRGPGKRLYKGVSYSKRAKAFHSTIRANGKAIDLGYFDTAEDAVRAYDNAAATMHGEFARTNGTPTGDLTRKRRANKYSIYKGANWNPRTKRWHAQISLNGRSTCIGLFSSDIEAAQAYDKAAKEIFGDGAVLNFPGRPKKFFEKFNSRISKKVKNTTTESQNHNG